MPCATCKPTEVARRAANVSSLNPPGQPEAATEATTTPATERPGPQAVADLVAAGQLTHAIAAASAALADPALDADERVALLALRFDSHFLRMELAQAGADVRAIKALARRPASPARQAQALICESQLQRRLGNAQASLVAARAALKAARRSSRPALEAHSLAALGNATGGRRRPARGAGPPAAGRSPLRGPGRHEAPRPRDLRPGGRPQRPRPHCRGRPQASGQALALARHCDDLLSQGNALNMLTFHLADQAQALKLYRQASAAFGAAGSLGGQMTVLGNTGDAYRELGLARRARRLIAEACPLARHAGMQQALFSHLQNRFDIEWHTGALGAARDTAAEATALLPAMQSRRNVGFPAYAAGQIALVEGQPAAAARLFEQAAEADSASDAGYAMASLGQAGRAHLAAGQRSEALAATRRSTGLHPAAGLAKLNGGNSVALWWAHCLAPRANGQRAEAGEALALACRFVLEAAQGLSDEGLRRSLLNKRAAHREVVRAWLQHARKLPRAQREAHLAGESQPREPFERLVDTGLRGPLLAMLAAQAAVALANLRAAEALERKVAERTAEARAAQARPSSAPASWPSSTAFSRASLGHWTSKASSNWWATSCATC